MPIPKKWGVTVFALATMIGVVWIYRNRRLFFVRDVTTGQSFDYPDLRSHVYFGSIDSVADATEKAILALSRWRLVFHDREKNIVVAEIEAPIGGFLSELTVSLSPLGPRHVRTVIRSRSATGRGDLGENARYIRQIQQAMDRDLVGG